MGMREGGAACVMCHGAGTRHVAPAGQQWGKAGEERRLGGGSGDSQEAPAGLAVLALGLAVQSDGAPRPGIAGVLLHKVLNTGGIALGPGGA